MNPCYFLDKNEFKQMKQQVRSGDNTKFQRLLNIFARDKISHPYMKECPDLCFKCTKLMQEELSKGKLSKDFVRKVIAQFIKNEVFSHARAENVIFKCKDGQVALNEIILRLYSDYFETMLTSEFAEGQETEEGKHIIDVSKKYSVNTLKLFKKYIYGQPLGNDNQLEILAELYEFSKISQCIKIAEECQRYLISHAAAISTSDQLETLVFILSQMKQIQDKELIALQTQALNSYLTALNIKHKWVEEGTHLIMDISYLGNMKNETGLGSLLKNYVSGFIVKSQKDTETLELLMFMPDDLKRKITHIIFDFFPMEKHIQEIDENFKHCRSIRFNMNCDVLGMPLEDSYSLGSGSQRVVYDIKSLANIKDLSKLTSIPLKYHFSHTSSGDFLFKLDRDSLKSLKKMPKITFDSKIVIEFHSGIVIPIYKNKLKKLKLFSQYDFVGHAGSDRYSFSLKKKNL